MYRARLRELEVEKLKLGAALAAVLEVERGGEIGARKKANGQEEIVIATKRRKYRYGYEAECSMCHNKFPVPRVAKPGSKRPNQYCHKPCTSTLHRAELKLQAAANHRGKTLFAGDALRGASH